MSVSVVQLDTVVLVLSIVLLKMTYYLCANLASIFRLGRENLVACLLPVTPLKMPEDGMNEGLHLNPWLEPCFKSGLRAALT
jgi:hypothetical protein